MQSPRIPGRKRGRPPLHSSPMKMAVHNLYSAPAGALPGVKIPKKRGRKPGYKLKSRVLMPPLAISPPRSTPEPDISSIPQDAATIPTTAAPQALTVSVYVDKQANVGPYLDRRKVQQLPERFGPARPAAVLQHAVQACIDCALQQKAVFALLQQGYGAEVVSVSASFEGKQHLLSLLVVNSIGYVLRFLKKLCRSLLCDNLFSNQPFQPYSTVPESPEGYENGRMEAGASSSLPENQPQQQVWSGERVFMVGMKEGERLQEGFRWKGGSSPAGSSSEAEVKGNAAGSSGGSSSPGLRRPTSSPTRNGSYPEGNTSASSPSPERQDMARPSSKNPSTWTVDDVVWFVKDADPHALGPHVELFRKHEIDGNALLLLKSDMIMKYLGLKLGPALKLCYHIDKLKQVKF
ncbi:SCML4 protein, partial [Nothoprocta ornata]|nr:SCML4 protein [Nothoprocta ornata]